MAMTPFGATSSSGFWGGAGGLLAGGLIGLVGSAIQGEGTKTAAIQARKQAKEQGRPGIRGTADAPVERRGCVSVRNGSLLQTLL